MCTSYSHFILKLSLLPVLVRELVGESGNILLVGLRESGPMLETETQMQSA